MKRLFKKYNYLLSLCKYYISVSKVFKSALISLIIVIEILKIYTSKTI